MDQPEEPARKTLKEIVHGEAKALGPEASVQEACEQLRSEKMPSYPVTDKNGEVLGTVSEGDINRKVSSLSIALETKSARKLKS